MMLFPDYKKDYVDFGEEKKSPRMITLIPLINIIFLLLIFFLVAGSIEKLDIIPVDVPAAKSGKLMDEGHITILLGRYDEVIVNDELVDEAMLPDKLETLLENNPERVITLKTDSSLPSKKMIDVMNAIKAAGGVNLSLVTQRR